MAFGLLIRYFSKVDYDTIIRFWMYRNKPEELLEMTDWSIAPLSIMLIAFIGQTAILYRKLGKLRGIGEKILSLWVMSAF